MEHIPVHFIRTVVLDFTHYVDLLTINGELKTHVMEKTAEPNKFSIKEQRDGDHVDEIVANWQTQDAA